MLVLQSRSGPGDSWGIRNMFAHENRTASKNRDLTLQLWRDIELMKSRWELCEPDTEFRIVNI